MTSIAAIAAALAAEGRQQFKHRKPKAAWSFYDHTMRDTIFNSTLFLQSVSRVSIRNTQ
jgi:hypothetical protein